MEQALQVDNNKEETQKVGLKSRVFLDDKTRHLIKDWHKSNVFLYNAMLGTIKGIMEYYYPYVPPIKEESEQETAEVKVEVLKEDANPFENIDNFEDKSMQIVLKNTRHPKTLSEEYLKELQDRKALLDKALDLFEAYKLEKQDKKGTKTEQAFFYYCLMSLGFFGRLLTLIKQHHLFLYETPHVTLNQTMSFLLKAFKNWQGKIGGFPKFKSFKMLNKHSLNFIGSSYFKYNTKGEYNLYQIKNQLEVKVKPRKTQLLDVLEQQHKLNEERVLNGEKAKNFSPTVTIATYKNILKSDLSAVCDYLKPIPTTTKPTELNQVLGLDLGVTDFASLSNGEIITFSDKAIEKFKKIENQIAKQQFKKSIKTRDSILYKKIGFIIARLSKQEKDLRKTCHLEFIEKIIKHCKENNIHLIAMEDLKVKNMSKKAKAKTPSEEKEVSDDGEVKWKYQGVSGKSGLNKAILEQGWYQFKMLLAWHCKKNGIELVEVDPKYTSQTCNKCKHVDSESRNGKVFKCTACGHEEDADVNGAKNIQFKGFELVQSPIAKEKKKTVKAKKKVDKVGEEKLGLVV